MTRRSASGNVWRVSIFAWHPRERLPPMFAISERQGVLRLVGVGDEFETLSVEFWPEQRHALASRMRRERAA